MSTTTATATPAAREGRAGHEGWVLALICLGQFMVILDVSIVNVALFKIQGSLHLSPTALQWVVNAYTLTFGGFLLLGGRAADLFGRRRIFLLGLGLFTAASLAGGLAPNGPTLLVARAVQGLGGAILSPATLTILTTTFTTPERRAKALGAWSAVAGAGGAVGVLLGGVLTQGLGWRWILFVNIPIGLFGLAAARLYLTESRASGDDRSLDVPGALLATGGLTAIVYAIVQTDSHGWTSGSTLGWLVAGLVLLGAFFAVERRATVPLLPLRLFRSRMLSSANAIMFSVGAAIFASWYFLSLFMQEVLHYSALKTGVAFLPQSVAIIVGAQVASRVMTRIGPRPLLVTAGLVSAAGLFWTSRAGAGASYWSSLAVPMVLITTGVGLAFSPLAYAATTGVDRRDAGLASGLINTMRQVGGALGLAALATVQVSRSKHLAHGTLTGATPAQLASGYDRALFVAGFVALFVALLAAIAMPSIGRGSAPAGPAQQEAQREQRIEAEDLTAPAPAVAGLEP